MNLFFLNLIKKAKRQDISTVNDLMRNEALTPRYYPVMEYILGLNKYTFFPSFYIHTFQTKIRIPLLSDGILFWASTSKSLFIIKKIKSFIKSWITPKDNYLHYYHYYPEINWIHIGNHFLNFQSWCPIITFLKGNSHILWLQWHCCNLQMFFYSFFFFFFLFTYNTGKSHSALVIWISLWVSISLFLYFSIYSSVFPSILFEQH